MREETSYNGYAGIIHAFFTEVSILLLYHIVYDDLKRPLTNHKIVDAFQNSQVNQFINKK